MSIKVAINHKTEYQYDRTVSLSDHVFRLRPAVHSRTPIQAYSLTIKPEKHFINWQQDPFGNFLARVAFQEKAKKLYFEVDLIADLTVINPFDFFVEKYAEHYPFEYDDQLKKELIPYLEIKEKGPLLTQWVKSIPENGNPESVRFLFNLIQRLWKEIRYTTRMEPGIQTCEKTLKKACGSCRDTSWLLVQILRHLGLAARFVSGYLIQLKPDEKALEGPSGPEKDFTDLHAWAEVYVPGAGWLGLDPTSGLYAGEGHIPLACTPEPASAAPVTGFTDKCKVEFKFSNSVQRIHEDPRVTQPYSEDQWTAIQQLGVKVDEDLQKSDVRLTMGGEPTFVSIDDMDGPEWNITADSPQKRKLAGELVKRLRKSFGPGGMLHYGQGKWYPGEELPRWRLSCYWRKDNIPIWHKEALIADDTRDYEFGLEDCQKFLQRLANRLTISQENIIPAYEDPAYYLWKEGKLPTNIDPLSYKTKDPLERQYLAKILDRGLGIATGYVLPLGWDDQKQSWKSSTWQFRREHLFLVPGGSPLGLRLPLESLPWVSADKREKNYPQSQFEDLSPLQDYRDSKISIEKPSESSEHQGTNNEVHEQKGQGQPDINALVHTALCIELQDGRMSIFMPPIAHLEHYLELVAKIENTAEELNMPILLSGYEPPKDYRIQKILVTPDPGVIEVNIHPASNWDELVKNTTVLYEQARLSRLSAQKFMLDGRHTGTGGGNHIVLGGSTPADSPMLRRPDLLRSLITYWQNHPGLSYFFSGLFIGPTSQAPRVDEGRNENLYELEVAFQQMPEGGTKQLWLIDRLLRHLLVDLTGNTHRSEFCIDKLYSPDSESGRLGLVELRAFEMPPHAKMSLVQMLLLRTLVAWFWNEPCKRKLVKWGTELHDRFMLPHFVWSDMGDVVADLNAHGFPFKLEWLKPFYEFRFPHYGSVSFHNIQLQLRFAIEPWHVLGEEVSSTGTARFVDSSVERLQIKVNGLTDSRHIITCNKRRLPLHRTGTRGEYVAGVRYRAWQPPSGLHPLIGIHSPLVFDVVDTWNGRSIGGCSYHVVHPGGRHYETFPVNAYEAETRREAQFWGIGHTPDTLRPPPIVARNGQFISHGYNPEPISGYPLEEEIMNESPYTLDLRRQPSAI